MTPIRISCVASHATDAIRSTDPTALLPAIVACLVLGGVSLAQAQIHIAVGDEEGDELGRAVGGAGDVDGDEHDDFAVGQPGGPALGSTAGLARAFSGADGSVLLEFEGDAIGDYLGTSVACAGDVDADGVQDIVVDLIGADTNGSFSGSARVYSGANGAVLYTFHGDAVDDEFGHSVAGADDVNLDGHADVLVGEAKNDANGTNAGRARLYSGLDGSVLHEFTGAVVRGLFGTSVAGVGDVDGDGRGDEIVGAHREDSLAAPGGTARVYSGRN